MISSKSYLFITNFSKESGSGHLFRCLSLADKLSEECARNITFSFDCDLDSESHFLREFKYDRINMNLASWENWINANSQSYRIVVDLPDSIDVDYLEKFLGGKQVARIIDNVHQFYGNDILIVPNLINEFQFSQFKSAVIHESQLFCGPQFMPLRSDFGNLIEVNIRNKVKRIGGYFGAVDKEHQSNVFVEASKIFEHENIEFVLVLGKFMESRNELLREEYNNLTVLESVDNMAHFLNDLDLFVGSFGISAWERFAASLPTLATFQNKDQEIECAVAARLGATLNLGSASNLTVSTLVDSIRELASDSQKLISMSVESYKIMKDRNRFVMHLIHTL